MIAGSPADWKLLTDLLEERFGLTFAAGRQEILEGRLRPRLAALHLDDIRAYYHYLRAHPEREVEFAELTRRITNNETYFLREAAHFDAIVEHLVPEFAPDLAGRPLRVLSAACSSGEEPYSLAIRLADEGLELRGIRWEIDACDLNGARLAQARSATYEGLAFRACDEEFQRRCFLEKDGRLELRARYRRGVRFFQANLAGPLFGASWGRYDIVLCRNLLIYFSTEAFDRLIAGFGQIVRPGGYLFLGHSESLFDRSSPFEAVHFPRTMAYRRKDP
ncbi:MAG TPA: protein-glutamate O-methyltransferase CheR [Gemmatimonadales bacterium]|nr:protein-glutamate O-methyltransferase CheR [Gemmatimonadales bacterium]